MANEDRDDVVVSSGWEDVDKSIGTGGKWLKFADGQSMTVNFFGAPSHVRGTFKEKTTDRVRFDVFIPGQGVKIWEVAGATYAELKEEKAACREPFADACFTVKRTGMDVNTRYRVRYARQLTPQEIAARSDAAAATGVAAAPDPF